MEFKYLTKCQAYDYLKNCLSEKVMSIIEEILQAYYTNKIDLDIPKDENGDYGYLLDECSLIINDKTYNSFDDGFDIAVLKWVEDFEDTGYLIEWAEGYENKNQCDFCKQWFEETEGVWTAGKEKVFLCHRCTDAIRDHGGEIIVKY